MIVGRKLLSEMVDEFLREKRPFVFYRLPGEKHPRLLADHPDSICLFYDLKQLNGQRGFVIAPFHVDEEFPIVLIKSGDAPVTIRIDNDRNEEEPPTYEPLESSAASLSSCTEEYGERFHLFMEKLCDGTFEKLVLSRSRTMERAPEFSPISAFYIACRRYTHSYVYLCYTPQTGVWLGSTPEILLSGAQNKWNTVALAGTQPLQNGQLPQVWNEKNRKEQEYVSAYIRSRLLSLGIHSKESGPYPAYAGALSHLKTDFSFSLKESGNLGDLLQLLHPTPAVCGLPKEEAYQFIRENEGYKRSYYSGFIGWIDPFGQTNLYVNLRCMQIEKDLLTLYAGGGLLASSELEDEWQETEKKLQTMGNLTAAFCKEKEAEVTFVFSKRVSKISNC